MSAHVAVLWFLFSAAAYVFYFFKVVRPAMFIKKAEQLEWVKADTVGSPLKWIKDRLFWWEHDQ